VLVRSTDVVCLDCRARYPLPSGATVTDGTCDDCGLPLARVERGRTFELCLDPGCEALYDVVTDAFDRAWDCPDCGADLRVERARGRVYLACDDRRDCETTVSIPDGLVVGECDCGLPVFETATGRRCADGACDRDWDPRRDGPDGRETDDDASRAG
jgi:DNA topoisomerase-1